MSNSFIIAGGWSVSQIDTRDLVRYGRVIGVNDAALWANVHICLTMDRLWFEHRWPYVKARRVPQTWVREKCDCNVPRKEPTDNWQTFKHFNKPTPSFTEGELHGGNSGTCAINLAMQSMDDGDRLFLLGFDMNRGPGNEPYWYPAYPWAQPGGATKEGHFNTWARDLHDFSVVAKAKGFSVYNVSQRSRITCFPQITAMNMWEMIE